MDGPRSFGFSKNPFAHRALARVGCALLAASLTACGAGDDSKALENQDALSSETAPVVEDLGPSCEEDRSKILPYSTKKCTGPFAVCETAGAPSAWKVFKPKTKVTMIKPVLAASGQFQCSQAANNLPEVVEVRDKKYVRQVLGHSLGSPIPGPGPGGATIKIECKIEVDETIYDRTRACLDWSLPFGQPQASYHEVGDKFCSTCDDVDPAADGVARGKCITKVVTANPPELTSHRDLLIAQLKFIHEWTGAWTAAEPFYASHPQVVPACGPAAVTDVSCGQDINAKLNLCQRLGMDFARAARSVRTKDSTPAITECNKLFDVLALQPAGSCQVSRDEALRVHRDFQAAIDRDFAEPWTIPPSLIPSNDVLVRRRFAQFRSLEQDISAAFSLSDAHEYLASVFPGVLDSAHLIFKRTEIPLDDSSLDDYLYWAHKRDLEIAKQTLTALYPPALPVKPTLGAWGQVQIVAKVLRPLSERVESFARVHDFGCDLGSCPKTSELDLEISKIVVPGIVTSGPWAFSSATGTGPKEIEIINDWSKLFFDFFGKASHAELLPQAVAKLLPGNTSPFAELAADQVPDSLRHLHGIVSRSADRWELFEKTGRLMTSEGKKIHRLTNLANRDKLGAGIDLLAGESVSLANQFKNEFDTMVNGILAGEANEAGLAGLKAEFNRLFFEFMEREKQIAAHRRAISTDTSFAERVKAMSKVVEAGFEGELANQFVAYADLKMKPVNASSALPFANREKPLSEYAALTGKVLQEGEFYQINVNGSWSPTCALRVMKDALLSAKSSGGGGWFDDLMAVINPVGVFANWAVQQVGPDLLKYTSWSQIAKVEPVDLDLDNVETGPEGFAIVQSQGKSYVQSAKTDLAPGYAGVSNGFSEESNLSTRVDATFHSGLRFSEDMILLPHNEAPVGSLLAVEMPEGKTLITEALNVYVVQAPSTVLIPSKAGTRFVLVANDNCQQLGDEDPNNGVALTVNSFVVTPGDKLIGAFVASMASVTGKLRTLTDNYVAQGELLSTDVDLLHGEAYALFKVAVEARSPALLQTPFNELPDAFQRLWGLFVQREINRIDRLVRIAQLDKELHMVEISVEALAEQVGRYETIAQLSARVKEEALGRLDILVQGGENERALEYMRSYLLPVFELWYPNAIALVRTNAQVKNLAKLTPFTSSLGYATAISNVLKVAAVEYKKAALTRANQIQKPMKLVLSIPDPESLCPGNSGPPPSGPATGGTSSCVSPTLANGMAVSPEQAAAFWTALRNAKNGMPEQAKVDFTVDPSMVYGDIVQPYHLICQATRPVVTRMGLMAIRTGSAPPPASEYTWPIHFGPKQQYVTEEGAQEYTLLDELDSVEDRLLVTNLLFGASTDFIERFDQAGHVAETSGISPFTTYTLDFGTFGPTLLNELAPVQQFVLVLEVEAESGPRANVPTCVKTPIDQF